MLGTPSSQRLPRHLTAAGSSTGLLGTEELVGGFEPPEVHDLDKHIRMDHITATGRLRSVHSDRIGDLASVGPVEERNGMFRTESAGKLAEAKGGPLSFLTSREGRLGVLSMVLLVFQGTALSLVLRYSRTRPGTQYLASVAVIYTEVVKLVICVGAQGGVCWRTAGERELTVREEMVHQAREILGKSYPMLIPAALFVMQQILVIVAASHLDAVTFQICSQSFKIMPTAVFAVWLLGQYLAPMQWASLPVLATGVVFVTLNGSTASKSGASDGDLLLLGLGASALSGLSSAYAGVYFEKYVKGKQGQTLWIRNLQLSIYGVPLSILYTFLKDGSAIQRDGLHQGFDSLAWSVVALQVFGGLIVGMVVKYADNILKNFANALSVIFTVLGAMPLFGQYPSGWFIVGVALVSLSVFMYGKSAPQLFAMFYSCAGCQKLLQTCEDDVASCLPLTGAKRRTSDGKMRRCGLITGARAIVLVLLLTMLLALLISVGHPPTLAFFQQGMQNVGAVLQGQHGQPRNLVLRESHELGAP